MSPSRSPDSDMTHQQAQSLSSTGPGWLVDISVIAVLTILTAGLLWTDSLPQLVVWVIGVPFVVFYPGYAVIAALFPEKAPHVTTSDVTANDSPTRLARVALAIVLSPVLLGVLAILLSPWNALELQPLLMGITAITLGGLLVTFVRRLFLPPHIREGMTTTEVTSWLQLSVPTNSRQNITLVLAVLLLLGVSVAAVAIPMDGESYTETYLLSETDEEFLAANLPDDVTAGDVEQFHVGIENQENEQVTYEIYTVFQELDEEGEVTAQQSLADTTVTISDEEQAIEEQSFTVPSVTGEHRVQVLVYEDGAPEELSADTADHVLQLQLVIADESD